MFKNTNVLFKILPCLLLVLVLFIFLTTSCYATDDIDFSDEDVKRRTVYFVAFEENKNYTCVLPIGLSKFYDHYFICTKYGYSETLKRKVYEIYVYFSQCDLLFSHDKQHYMWRVASSDYEDTHTGMLEVRYYDSLPDYFDFSFFDGNSYFDDKASNGELVSAQFHYGKGGSNLTATGLQYDNDHFNCTYANYAVRDFNGNILFEPAEEPIISSAVSSIDFSIVQTEILQILPVIFVVLILLIGLFKAFRFLRSILRSA